MIDVQLATPDGLMLLLGRHTEPDPDTAQLLQEPQIPLPDQPPPRILPDQTTVAP